MNVENHSAKVIKNYNVDIASVYEHIYNEI